MRSWCRRIKRKTYSPAPRGDDHEHMGTVVTVHHRWWRLAEATMR